MVYVPSTCSDQTGYQTSPITVSAVPIKTTDFNTPVICNHASHLQGRVRDSWTKVQSNEFSIVLTAGVQTLRSLPPVEFSVMWGVAKSCAITISGSQQGGTYTRAIKMKRH